MSSSEFRTLSVTLPPHDGEGLLGLPATPARGIVLFAHGSGSSRLSPRNAFVAEALQRAGMATLLFDLLTEHEASSRANVFDIPLLADRLDQAATWVCTTAAAQGLPLGFFGASTGAAAALVAAAGRKDIRAIVSRGGRPDLAEEALENVTAPTLLIVGGHDPEVLALNRSAHRRLHCERRLEVVPGATHLFEEPGTLESVVALARAWFLQHLAPQCHGGKSCSLLIDSEAGRRLAERLLGFKDKNPIVLALPRGGVPVGFEIARALAAPLDLVLVRKIGAPHQEELAIGAIADGEHPELVTDPRTDRWPRRHARISGAGEGDGTARDRTAPPRLVR